MGIFYGAALVLLIGLVESAVVLPAGVTLIASPVRSQFQSQDLLGQYAYGYDDGLTAKSEVRSVDGITRGFYRYVDAEGKMQSVDYTADPLRGFRVAATNLPKSSEMMPQQVADTPEVAKGKADHMVAVKEVQMRNEMEMKNLMEKSNEMARKASEMMPVRETLEVAKARAEHMAAHESEKLRAAILNPGVQIAGISTIPALAKVSTNILPGGFSYKIDEPLAIARYWSPWQRSFVVGNPVVLKSDAIGIESPKEEKKADV